MSVQHDVDQVLAWMREGVAERGADYVYEGEGDPIEIEGPGCRYIEPSGKPGCIVGYVLHKAGLLPSVFDAEFNWGQWRDDADAPEGAYRRLGDRFTRAANETLRRAQGDQDVGAPWGDAVERAAALAIPF